MRLYETISAIGIRGLDPGVTPVLPELSKAVVLLLMFAGRVGSMSVAMAVTGTILRRGCGTCRKKFSLDKEERDEILFSHRSGPVWTAPGGKAHGAGQ